MSEILSFVTLINLKDIMLCEEQDENYCMPSIIFGILYRCAYACAHIHVCVYIHMCREYLCCVHMFAG